MAGWPNDDFVPVEPASGVNSSGATRLRSSARKIACAPVSSASAITLPVPAGTTLRNEPSRPAMPDRSLVRNDTKRFDVVTYTRPSDAPVTDAIWSVANPFAASPSIAALVVADSTSDAPACVSLCTSVLTPSLDATYSAGVTATPEPGLPGGLPL